MLLLAACWDPWEQDDEEPSDKCVLDCDSGVDDADSESDADGDADSDDTGDEDTGEVEDTGEAFVPETDWEAGFTGWRNFYFDYSGYECDDTIEENGEWVVPDDALIDLCDDCDHFFEVTSDAESVCDGYLGIANPTWRGVAVDAYGDVAALYFFREEDDGLEEFASDEAPTFDDETLGFYYFYEVGGGYGLDITGEMTFTMTEE